MKCQFNAKDLKTAIKSMNAVFSVDKTDNKSCKLTVNNKNKILIINVAFAGIYARRIIPITVLRPGTTYCSLKDLEALPIKGKTIIEANKYKILVLCGKSKWSFSVDISANAEVEAHSNDMKSVVPVAKVPISIFKSATKTTNFKTFTGDMLVQFSIQNGRFEYVTRDYIGYARYMIEEPDIKSRNTVNALLPYNILKTVLKDAKGSAVIVGSNNDASLIYFKTEDTFLLCPGTTGKIVNIDKEILTKCKSSNKTLGFSTKIPNLQKALDAVMPAYKTGADVTLVPKNGAIFILASSASHSARHKLETDDVFISNQEAMSFNIDYIAEFTKSAPSGLPITVEAWEKTYLYLLIKTEAGLIDYMIIVQN